jgi:hypothetical protein
VTELLQLNFRRRIQALSWSRRLSWVVGIVAVLYWRTGRALFAAIGCGGGWQLIRSQERASARRGRASSAHG